MYRCALFVAMCILPVLAGKVDTTIVADGGPGPYRIATGFVDTTTLTVRILPDSQITAIPYAFLPDLNAVLFSEPIDSGTVISVEYLPIFRGAPKIHYLYEKRFGSLADTSSETLDSLFGTSLQTPRESELTVSGFKSIGVSVGNLGQANLEQAMDVSVFGQVSDQTRLKAHLSDQGSSLDGATREISEIDMIYVTLDHPFYSVTVGDQYLSWPQGGLLLGTKKVKGIAAEFRPSTSSAKVFGALSGGAFAVETFRGQTGLQGPYFLTGNDPTQLITPIGGTVAVWVNGMRLSEGPQEDFTVDYDFGAITFTPDYMVKEDDIIRVEYEYKVFDYQRMVGGAHVAAATSDSAWRIQGALWVDTDNKNHPLDLELSATDRDSLAQSGDRTYTKTMFAYPVDPRDADSVAIYTGIYVKSLDSLGRPYFRWTQNYRTDTTLYRVPFRKVESGTGEYDSVTYCPPLMNGPCYPVYQYVGSGGNFSARASLPSPQRKTVGEILASGSPAPWLSISVDFAGQEHDKNLFSSRDDNDNLGYAGRSSIRLGSRDRAAPGAWLSIDHEYFSERFDHKVLSSSERTRKWNDTSVVADRVARQSWESTGGISLGSRLSGSVAYGQLWKADSLDTDRLSLRAGSTPRNRFTLGYSGDLFRHYREISERRSRRQEVRASWQSTAIDLRTSLSEEWFWDSTGIGAGHVSGTAGFLIHPIKLDESITVTSYRNGTEDLFSPDTGYSLLWKQSLSHQLFPWWKLAGSSSFRRRVLTRTDQTSSTTLAHVRSDISTPKRGFSSTQDYRINSERASMFIQVPTYVGPGLGTHRYDTSGAGTDPYVPDQNGSWSVIEQEYKDAASTDRIRKTRLEVAWSYFPQHLDLKGILGDLDWRGALLVAEHLGGKSADTLPAWVPGLLSLKGDTTAWQSRYADLSYRQSVDWRPREFAGWHADLFGKPFMKVVRGQQEQGWEYGGGLDKRWDRLYLGSRINVMTVRTPDTHFSSEQKRLLDTHGELTQRFRIVGNLEATGSQVIGKAGSTPEESFWYYSVTPGLRWRSLTRGFAQADYTFSHLASETALDYRLAQGRSPGTSHVFNVVVDIRTGEHFSINGTYRGEIAPKSPYFDRNIHIVSVGVRAYL